MSDAPRAPASAGRTREERGKRGWRNRLAVAAGLLLVAQLLGPLPSDPPPSLDPSWDPPRTKDLARVACLDCHGGSPRYPAYSRVAPARWWVRFQVVEGRRRLDLLRPDTGLDLHALVRPIRDGSMPPRLYLATHPDARLSGAQRDSLAAGLLRTLQDDADPLKATAWAVAGFRGAVARR